MASSQEIKVSEEEKEVSFKSLGVVDELCEACEHMKWKTPTAIQKEAIPVALQGRDIIGIAETGSGKTAAFAIPILQALLNTPRKNFALVLTPTRDLAFQIGEQFDALGASIGLKTAVIVGGMNMDRQRLILLKKKPHIIIGTPGRLADHVENTRGFSLKTVKYLVMDEADRILDLGLEMDVDVILNEIRKDRHTYLYSATMTEKVQKLQRASLIEPVKVQVSNKYQTVEKLKQYYLFIPFIQKDAHLVHLLNELPGNSIIVFRNSCAKTHKTALLLRHLGFTAIPYNSQLRQETRFKALSMFKLKPRSILIATDVASGGLDMLNVDVVINFDVPKRPKDYLQRVGRTARAGRAGLAVTFVTQYCIGDIQTIEHYALNKKKLDLYPLVNKDIPSRLLETVRDALNRADKKLKEREKKEKAKRREKKKRNS